jgi:hypothetical protein
MKTEVLLPLQSGRVDRWQRNGMKRILLNKRRILHFAHIPLICVSIPLGYLKFDLYYVKIWDGIKWETLKFSKD